MANGSRQEVETQIELARLLGYIGRTEADDPLTLSEEVGRLIAGLMRSIE